MKQKLNMAALDLLEPHHDTFINHMRVDTKNLTVDISTLLANGWSGEAADTFQPFYDKMDAAHVKMADGVESWSKKLCECSQKGKTAIVDASSGLLKQLDGSGSGQPSTYFEYEDMTYDNPSTMSNSYYPECNDVASRLEFLESKQNALHFSYNFDIKPVRTRISQMAEGYIGFGNQYVTATRAYDDYRVKLGDGLTNAVSELEAVHKDLKEVEPPVGTKDPSNPVYRAIQFTDNILLRLPGDKRDELYNAVYAADIQYRTIFFAYVDQIGIAGTNGAPFDPNTSGMSLPNIGIFIDPSQSDWLRTFFHEYGHSVDYLTGNRSGELNGLIDQDVEKQLSDIANNIPGYTDAERQEAVARFMRGEKIDPNDKSATGQIQREIYQVLLLKYQNASTGKNNYSIIDVYGGATNNAAITDDQGNRGGGHRDDYWTIVQPLTENKDWIVPLVGFLLGGSFGATVADTVAEIFVPKISPGLEHYAHSFSDGMLNNTANQTQTGTMLPETTKELDGIMDETYEKAKERLGW